MDINNKPEEAIAEKGSKSVTIASGEEGLGNSDMGSRTL